MKRLNFEDGSFLTLLYGDENSWYVDTPYLESGTPLALALPNSVICLDSTTGAVSDGVYRKTDQYGNLWTITIGSSLSKIEIGSTVILSYPGYLSAILHFAGATTIGVSKVFNNYTPALTKINWQINAGTTNYTVNTAFCYRSGGINGSTFNETANLIQSNTMQASNGIGGTVDYKANSLFSNAVLNFYSKDNIPARIGAVYPYCYAVNLSGVTTGTANISGSGEDFNPITPSIDPYEEAGNSSTGGGGGSWDNSSDPVPVPALPAVGATNTGFISLFVPTQAQLQQVANYLWSNLFDVSTFFKLFENPMDCILGLSVVPVSIPTSGNAQITVGNIELSGITLPLASQQYVEVDCGSLTVDPYFGSYLDYEPYTKMSLFVPYSGIHSVNADDIMGKTVNLIYHIDILTGSLVAFLKCGDSVLYEFNGACSSNIPVNSINYASTIENAIRIAVNIGTTVATAGAAAPATVATQTGLQTAQNAGRAISLAGSTAEGALSMKPNIDRAGSLGGTTGILGNQIPYFIVTRPRLCKPKDQNKIKGYPAFINYTVSELKGKGYTEFDTILLTGMYLTDDEKNELERILEGGVYL